MGDRPPQAPRLRGRGRRPAHPPRRRSWGGRCGQGLWHAHVGWLFTTVGQADRRRYGADLLKDRGIRVIDASEKPLILVEPRDPLPARAGDQGQPHRCPAHTRLGWPLRIFLLHHATFSINSICHFFGRRRFATDDESTNVALAVALDLRRVLAQQPPRVPDLGLPRPAPRANSIPVACSSAGWSDSGLPGTSCASARDRQRKKAVGSSWSDPKSLAVLLGLILALASAAATNLAFLFKQRGAVLAPPILARHPVRSAVGLFRSRWFLVGWLVAIVAWGLHVGALSLAPLSIVQAVLSGGLVFLAVSPSASSAFSWVGGNGSASRSPRPGWWSSD